jgi:hypothetical protein
MVSAKAENTSFRKSHSGSWFPCSVTGNRGLSPILEVQQQMDAMQQTEIFHLKQTIEETEAMGGDPLGELAKQLMQQISERKIQLEIARQV